MRKAIQFFLALSLLAVAGCGPSESGKSVESAEWDERLADRARLVERLPEQTWLYLRVPGIWGLVFAPKNNALAPALSSEANLETVGGLQAALGDTLSSEFSDLAPLLGPLLHELRSPIELALVGDGDQPMNADLVIEVRVAMETVEAINTRMEQIAIMHDLIRVITPARADAAGLLFAGPSAIHYRFDSASQRLLMATGMAVTAESFEQAAAWPTRGESRLQEMEQRIDESRQGLVLWADIDRLRPMLGSGVLPSQLKTAAVLGALDVDQLALGYGIRGGKGTMAVLATGSDGALRDLALPQHPPPELQTAGRPRLLVGMTLPGSAWLRNQVLPAIEDEAADASTFLRNLDDGMFELTGASLERWLDALAGRLYYLEDDNGGYLVHQPAAENFWPGLLDDISSVATTRPLQDIDGRTIHHTTISGPDLTAAMDDESGMQLNPQLIRLWRLYSRLDTHVYWLEENGTMLLADVPQVLADRLRNPATHALDTHLAEVGVPLESAVLFGAMRLAEAPRRNYYTYLGVLQAMADLFEHEIDLSRFPSARELALPESGDGGFRVDFTGDSIGLALTFENHPGDLLYGTGGIAVVAVAGIVAAVAIPAYQDYVARTKVNLAMETAKLLKREVEVFRMDHQRWPQVGEVHTSIYNESDDPVRSVTYKADPPAVVLEMSEGGRILLLPELDDEGLAATWRCVAEDVREALLSSECR